MFVNISQDPGKYYSQRNNLLKPTIRCKPTATVEALDLAGWPLPFGPYKQPEDNLTAYCEKRFGPDSPEDWEDIVKAVNEYFEPAGQPAVLRYDWPIAVALFGLTQGLPFAASTYLTKGGHVVNLVGFESCQPAESVKKWPDLDMSAVKSIIIDDPYGNRTSGAYVDNNGFNCHYSYDEFVKVWRGIGIQVRKKETKN